MKRRFAIATAIAIASAIYLWSWWVRDLRQTPCVFNGPMVQSVSTEGFTLTWEIAPDVPAHVAVLDAEGAEIVSVPAERNVKPVTSTLTRWSATIQGLKPGCSYRYRITAHSPAGPNAVLSEHTIRTAVRPGQPFRFLAFGDTGTGRWPQYRVARQLAAWTPDLILHAGDIITPKALRKDLPAKLFRPYMGLLASVPMYPCLGNHDYRVEQGQPILDTFVLPDNGPAGEQPGHHYWFDWGDARFVFIDSNHDLPYYVGIVGPWLDRVLGAAGDRWTIIVWHEPVYTHGDKYPPAKKLLLSLVPVLDQHRCTLVLSGHQHLYERSRPIRDGQVVAKGEGTVYIVTGAGGCNLYNELTPQSPLIAASCDTQHSFTAVDVTPDRLALRQIGVTGELLDGFQIEKHAK